MVGEGETKEARAIFAHCIGNTVISTSSLLTPLKNNTACFTAQRQKECMDFRFMIFCLPDVAGLNHICKTFRLNMSTAAPANIASTAYARIYLIIACPSLCKSRDPLFVRVIALGEEIGPQRGFSRERRVFSSLLASIYIAVTFPADMMLLHLADCPAAGSRQGVSDSENTTNGSNCISTRHHCLTTSK